MCLPVLTPKAILSKEDGGKQEVAQLLEISHPSRSEAGNQMSLVGGRKQGGGVVRGHFRCLSLARLRVRPDMAQAESGC